jgi:protein-tyrosine phosphatase
MYRCFCPGCDHYARGLCGGCRLVGYCSITCVKEDWPRHFSHLHRGHIGEHLADEVLPRIWIGSVESLRNVEFMRHIQAVVTVFPRDKVDEDILAHLLEGKHDLRIEIEDKPTTNITQYFEPCAEWIHKHHERGESILVHCIVGHSRSTTLVIYYMLRYLGYTSVDSALYVLRTRRPYVRPNEGFIMQLETAAQGLLKK